MSKTIATVTDEQIEALRAEAAQAGDMPQVALCDRALDGDEAARAKCADAIADAEAMGDGTTYTVRPLGQTAWESGIATLTAAIASAREAREAGLRGVAIIDDSTGRVVDA